MSSLRNSLHRRNHKERSQLSHRSKFGILEKHKDYVIRAKDYHSKKDRIRRLKQKAADRNKDEFYFGMVNQRTQRGVHVQDRGNVSLPVDMVKILKTQDENYVRTMRTLGLKKIDRLKEQLTALADLAGPSMRGEEDAATDSLTAEEVDTLRRAGIFRANNLNDNGRKRQSKHMIFVEDEAEAKSMARSAAGSKDESNSTSHVEDDVDLGWTIPKKPAKKSKKAVANDDAEAIQEAERQEAAKDHRTRLLKELSARLTRDTQLRYACREFEMQRLLMGKGGSKKVSAPEKVGGESDEDDEESDHGRRKSGRVDEKTYKPRVYKWRAERKR